MEVFFILILGVTIGLIVFFFFCLLAKWDILSYYELKRARWMPETCVFCLGFWLSCIGFAFFFLVASQEPFKWQHLFAICIATVINHMLIAFTQKSL